jgi:micrococcal nuclease
MSRGIGYYPRMIIIIAALVLLGCHDGDTCRFRNSDGIMKVRFADLDCPEADQPGGPEARAETLRLLSTGPITLEARDTDRYGRTVATVIAGGVNVNEKLVADGYCLEYPTYDRDPVMPALELSAREARIGVWAAHPIPPWEWRKRGH